jgi:hypothetical protein
LKKLIIDCPAAIADRDTHFRFAWYGIPSLQVDLRTYDLCIRVKFDAVRQAVYAAAWLASAS